MWIMQQVWKADGPKDKVRKSRVWAKKSIIEMIAI